MPSTNFESAGVNTSSLHTVPPFSSVSFTTQPHGSGWSKFCRDPLSAIRLLLFQCICNRKSKKKHFTTEKKKRKTRWPRVKLAPRCAHPYAHALPHYPGRCQATMDSCFSFGTPLGFAKPASSSVGYAMLASSCPKRLKSAFFFKRCSIMLLLKITSYH